MARSRQMVASSISTKVSDPELSVLFAAHAVAATWPWGHNVLPEAEYELRRAIIASRIRVTLRGHGDFVEYVAWNPKRNRLATASVDGTAKVWDAASGQDLLTLRGHGDTVTSVAWSPDGTRLATASWDETVKVWDGDSGKELLTLRGHSRYVESIVWSPDGKRLATGSDDGTAKVWDAVTGHEIRTLSGPDTSYIYSVDWSPDGKHLATGSREGTATVWDAASGQVVATLSVAHDPVKGVVWSPDGKRLATASGSAKVWDVARREEVLNLSEPGTPIYSVAWSPDGKRLATAGGDETAKVWDADSGEEVLTLNGHGTFVYCVAWSSDGKHLATASGDMTALLDFEFLACGGDASIANMHGDTKSNCKYRRGTSAFRAYVMQQQKSSASAEPSCFAKLTTFATWWKVMDNPGKRLIILSSAEIDALYGRPRFTQEERTEYFALSDSKRAALSQLHPTLAQFLKAWNVQTPYARETDFVFFSLKANGRIPVSPAVLVADHLRLAAIKAGVQIAKGQRFSLHNLVVSLTADFSTLA
jgi:Tol biopolymer transport system component